MSLISAIHKEENIPTGDPYLIRRYDDFHKLLKLSETQAFQFLVSEVGELADALVSNAGNSAWVRNNPGREHNVGDEAGDMLMMLYVTCMERVIDPFEAMLEKFKREGMNEV